MFDTSNINHSGLSPQRPRIDYDIKDLEEKGMKLRYALHTNNPEYVKVIDQCRENNIPYEVIENINGQNHIWIKKS